MRKSGLRTREAMKSGFKVTSMILTSCQIYSVRLLFFSFCFFILRLNKFDEYNVSSQATAWVKK